MEVKNEMGQVGFVTQKLSEFDIAEAVDKKSFENTSSTNAERKKNEDIVKAEATDVLMTPISCAQDNGEADEQEKEENFLYSGKGNGKAKEKSSIHSINENGYRISANWTPFEHVSCRRNISSALQSDCKKDEESSENQVDTKKDYEVIAKTQADSKKRQDVGMKIQANFEKREEIMEFKAERDQEEVKKFTFPCSEKLPNVDFDFDGNKRLYWYEPPTSFGLDKSDVENEMDLTSSSACENGQDISNGTASISDNQESNKIEHRNKPSLNTHIKESNGIDLNLPASPLNVQNIGINSILSTSDHQESKKKERWHKPSLNLCLQESDAIGLNFATSSFEKGQDIGLNSILSENDSYQTRNELLSFLNMHHGTSEIRNGIDSNPLESQNGRGAVLYSLHSEQERSVYESLAGNKNGYSPPERDNAHNVAMILTPSEDQDDNETANLASEFRERLEISNNSSMLSEYEIVSGDSSFDCSEDQAGFICNECKHDQESCSEYVNCAPKSKQETFNNLNLPAHGAVTADLKSAENESGQKAAKNLVSIVSEKEQKYGDILLCNESENEKETVNNYVSSECQDQQTVSEIPVSREYKDQSTGTNLMPSDHKNEFKPSKELLHSNYLKDKKPTTIQDKLQRGTLSCSEYGVSKTDKVSTSSLTLQEDDFEIPGDSLVEKIVRQAEFYLSDFNVLKNNFLLKHIRRNKEGYISLKLVSSFRKIKSLTKDCRVVAYSLEGSKLLKLNAEKNKVRRIEKIPNLRDTSFGKTVVVFNLPFKNPTAKDLKDMFSKFGSIVSAEIMTPKSPNYNTYHKRCRFYNHEISSTLFGVVEFEKYEDALAAVKDEESYLPKENKLEVVPLVAQKYRSDWTNSRSSSRTFIPVAQRGRFRPKSDVLNGRQAYAAKINENEPSVKQPAVEAKFHRGSYRPRYAWRPSSQIDVGGKLSAAKPASDEVGGKSSLLKRQLKVSNTLNVPFHHQQRGPGRAIQQPPGFHGPRFDA